VAGALMKSTFACAVSVTVAIVAGLGVSAAPQAPDAQTLQLLAAQYVLTYAPKVSGLSLEEAYDLTEVEVNRSIPPRRITSDLILVDLPERLVAFRDTYALDGRATRESGPRIITLLTPATTASWQRAQELALDSAPMFLDRLVVRLSDPLLALQFVRLEKQPLSTWKVEGQKRIGGVQTTALSFKEKTGPSLKYLLNTADNASASGRFWMNPTTGAIHQTELWVQSKSEIGRTTVQYAPDSKLEMLIPREATHVFELFDSRTRINSLAALDSSTKYAFDASVKYSNPRATKIDLTGVNK
jgi:hypothetical protein